MPSFRHKYPYTDNHELNLDWIIAAIKKLKIKVHKGDIQTLNMFPGSHSLSGTEQRAFLILLFITKFVSVCLISKSMLCKMKIK